MKIFYEKYWKIIKYQILIINQMCITLQLMIIIIEACSRWHDCSCDVLIHLTLKYSIRQHSLLSFLPKESLTVHVEFVRRCYIQFQCSNIHEFRHMAQKAALNMFHFKFLISKSLRKLGLNFVLWSVSSSYVMVIRCRFVFYQNWVKSLDLMHWWQSSLEYWK